MSKKVKSAESYRSQLRSLKKIIDIKIDARKTLSRTDKAKITRLYNEYKPDSIHVKRFLDVQEYLTPEFKNAIRLRKMNTYRKAQLKEYHKSIKNLRSRKHIEYRGNDPQKLKEAQRFAQQDNVRGLAVAFIPYSSAEKPRISWSKSGELILNTQYEKQIVIKLDPYEMEFNEDEYLSSILDQYPKYELFRIHAGDYFIKQTQDRGQIIGKLKNLLNEYNLKENNNYWGNWLGSLTAILVKKQKGKGELEKAEKQAKALKSKLKVKKAKLKKTRRRGKKS